MQKNFVNFAKTKFNVDVIEITTIQDPTRRKDGTQPIVVQMMSSDRKTELMQRRGQLRATNIFPNDHLSPKNSELFREARRLKRGKKVFGAWTIQSKVFAKKTETDQKFHVKSMAGISQRSQQT